MPNDVGKLKRLIEGLEAIQGAYNELPDITLLDDGWALLYSMNDLHDGIGDSLHEANRKLRTIIGKTQEDNCERNKGQ